MGVVIDGGTAGVHPDMARLDGRQLLDPARQRVVDPHSSGSPTSTVATAMAAIPSARPSAPIFATVVAFTDTRSTFTPMARAMLRRIASACGEIFSFTPTILESTLT